MHCALTPKLGHIPRASSSNVRSVMMANKGRNTGPERALRKALRGEGISGYRINHRIGRKRLDIAFVSSKVALFVDGCFWHRCPYCNLPMPKSHAAYWKTKFSINRSRDAETSRQLREGGWTVLRFWEHEIASSLTSCTARVARVLRTSRSSSEYTEEKSSLTHLH